MVALGTLEEAPFRSSSHTWVIVGVALLVACTEVGQKRKDSRETIWGLWLADGLMLQHTWAAFLGLPEILVAEEEEGRGPGTARREIAGTFGDGC